MNAEGHVWIVGAGPGDPGLLTVAGARALAKVDVVLYDALAAPSLLRDVRSDAELVYVVQAETSQETYSVADFAKKFRWKNAPNQVKLAE